MNVSKEIMFNYQGCTQEMVYDGVRKYGPAQGARKVLDLEYLAAQQAESQTDGVYKTFFNASKNSECFRIASKSRCFCGHLLQAHNKSYVSKKPNTGCTTCTCKSYKWMPIRPEECGMYWLPRRKDFKVATWRPPCKCKHHCEEHDPNSMKCRACKGCHGFWSDFACISCDGRWEDHEVLYQTREQRRKLGKKVGKQFYPLSDHKQLHQIVFKKEEKEIKYDESLMRKQPKGPQPLQSPMGIVFKPKYPQFLKK